MCMHGIDKERKFKIWNNKTTETKNKQKQHNGDEK